MCFLYLTHHVNLRRFVPDDTSFEGRQVRDKATHVPSNYQAPGFVAGALQHTAPNLTWDADDQRRKKVCFLVPE